MSINANNAALNEILEAINELPSSKEEQSKIVDITENGTTMVTPDEGKTLDKVTVNVVVETGNSTEEIENLIDESGVLDSTDGTATEKVEKLIDKAADENAWYEQSAKWAKADQLFINSTIKKPPRMNLENVSSINHLFASSTVETIDYYINCSKSQSAIAAFQNTKSLRFMVGVDLSSTNNINELFRNSNVETIQEPLNLSSVTTCARAFWADKIKNICFVENSIKFSFDCGSPYLTPDSVQSIIDGLATVETAQTLTFNATVKAKLTEEQLATITSKNWNLA